MDNQSMIPFESLNSGIFHDKPDEMETAAQVSASDAIDKKLSGNVMRDTAKECNAQNSEKSVQDFIGTVRNSLSNFVGAKVKKINDDDEGIVRSTPIMFSKIGAAHGKGRPVKETSALGCSPPKGSTQAHIGQAGYDVDWVQDQRQPGQNFGKHDGQQKELLEGMPNQWGGYPSPQKWPGQSSSEQSSGQLSSDQRAGQPSMNQWSGQPSSNQWPGQTSQYQWSGQPSPNQWPDNPSPNQWPDKPSPNQWPGNPSPNQWPGNPSQNQWPGNPSPNQWPGNHSPNQWSGYPSPNQWSGHPTKKQWSGHERKSGQRFAQNQNSGQWVQRNDRTGTNRSFQNGHIWNQQIDQMPKRGFAKYIQDHTTSPRMHTAQSRGHSMSPNAMSRHLRGSSPRTVGRQRTGSPVNYTNYAITGSEAAQFHESAFSTNDKIREKYGPGTDSLMDMSMESQHHTAYAQDRTEGSCPLCDQAKDIAPKNWQGVDNKEWNNTNTEVEQSERECPICPKEYKTTPAPASPKDKIAEKYGPPTDPSSKVYDYSNTKSANDQHYYRTQQRGSSHSPAYNRYTSPPAYSPDRYKIPLPDMTPESATPPTKFKLPPWSSVPDRRSGRTSPKSSYSRQYNRIGSPPSGRLSPRSNWGRVSPRSNSGRKSPPHGMFMSPRRHQIFERSNGYETDSAINEAERLERIRNRYRPPPDPNANESKINKPSWTGSNKKSPSPTKHKASNSRSSTQHKLNTSRSSTQPYSHKGSSPASPNRNNVRASQIISQWVMD